jgi:lysophospholipase L1-like esterase
MNRLTALALLGSLTIAGGPAPAATCPVPDDFTFGGGALAATTAAIAKHQLTILALGGASTIGGPAGGAAFAYPARLEARLRDALPGVAITVAVRAVARERDAALLAELDTSLAALKPTLVIWGPGGSAAARGDDLDTFTENLNGVIAKIQLAGADLILMTLQYAPSVSRLVNLYPYRMAVLRAGDDAGVPVLDRYELMRFWSDNDFLNLDATNADDRIHVSRALFDCMAEILGGAIVDAAK